MWLNISFNALATHPCAQWCSRSSVCPVPVCSRLSASVWGNTCYRRSGSGARGGGSYAFCMRKPLGLGNLPDYPKVVHIRGNNVYWPLHANMAGRAQSCPGRHSTRSQTTGPCYAVFCSEAERCAQTGSTPRICSGGILAADWHAACSKTCTSGLLRCKPVCR